MHDAKSLVAKPILKKTFDLKSLVSSMIKHEGEFIELNLNVCK